MCTCRHEVSGRGGSERGGGASSATAGSALRWSPAGAGLRLRPVERTAGPTHLRGAHGWALVGRERSWELPAAPVCWGKPWMLAEVQGGWRGAGERRAAPWR